MHIHSVVSGSPPSISRSFPWSRTESLAALDDSSPHPPQPLAPTFDFLSLRPGGSTCEWNPTASDWLLSLRVMSLKLTHVAACGRISLLVMAD